MAITNDMKIRRSEGIVWRTIDGEVVVLSPHDVSLHALTGCGSRVWELLGEQTSVAEIVQTICSEYEVEPDRAAKDIAEFVNKLIEMKLVEIAPAAIGEVTH